MCCVSKAPHQEEPPPAVLLATYDVEKYVLSLQLPNDSTVHMTEEEHAGDHFPQQSFI